MEVYIHTPISSNTLHVFQGKAEGSAVYTSVVWFCVHVSILFHGHTGLLASAEAF